MFAINDMRVHTASKLHLVQTYEAPIKTCQMVNCHQALLEPGMQQ
jgi:hypothetical protein